MALKLPSLKTNDQLASMLLRTGLALVFLYATVAAVRDPGAWEPFLPRLLTDHFPADILLKLFAFFQLILVVWLISGWRVRYAAALTALTLFGIILANPNALDITFRDVGLVFMALALLFT